MKNRLGRFLQVVTVVLVIPTQYGTVSCTSEQLRHYLDWTPPTEAEAPRRGSDPVKTDGFINALRNSS